MISRVDPQIFRGAMSHNMILSLDLSDSLLAAVGAHKTLISCTNMSSKCIK
jgi:hypothetical protein